MSQFALSVDDDPYHNKTLETVLKKFDIQLFSAESSEQFYRILHEKKFSIFFVDINIETMGSGFELIKYIRKNISQSVPLIVISNFYNQQVMTRALDAGATDFITKPIDKDIFLTKLSFYIQNELLSLQQHPLVPIPENGNDVVINLAGEVTEISEEGLFLTTHHLLRKGAVYTLQGDILGEVLGSVEPVPLTVESLEIFEIEVSGDQRRPKKYRAFLRWNSSWEGAARRWLVAGMSG